MHSFGVVYDRQLFCMYVSVCEFLTIFIAISLPMVMLIQHSISIIIAADVEQHVIDLKKEKQNIYGIIMICISEIKSFKMQPLMYKVHVYFV